MMTVETQFYTFAQSPQTFPLDSGQVLSPVTIAYETYGDLNSSGDNAILIVHGFTADAHAAGIDMHTGARGWWDDMIGPGKPFDTDRYFVVSSNCIGGCKGSTGPSSIDGATGEPYGASFPAISIADMVRAQRELLSALGVTSLATVAGASMGGMQALQWMVSYPGFVRTAIPIACAARLSPMSLAMAQVSRSAILNDPDWRGGAYYGKVAPVNGLALARMAAHLTYISPEFLDLEYGAQPANLAPGDFDVQRDLLAEGERFVQRFDANSFLSLSAAIERFDLHGGSPTLADALRGVVSRVLLLSFTTDWLFPAGQLAELHSALREAEVDAAHEEIETPYGHDAFLTDWQKIAAPIKRLLA